MIGPDAETWPLSHFAAVPLVLGSFALLPVVVADPAPVLPPKGLGLLSAEGGGSILLPNRISGAKRTLGGRDLKTVHDPKATPVTLNFCIANHTRTPIFVRRPAP